MSVAYYVGAKIGVVLKFDAITPSVLWPPNAILTAVLLLVPPRRWWIYLLAAFPAHLVVEMQARWPTPLVLTLFLTNCSEAVIAAALVRRFSDGAAAFDTLRGVVVFIVGAGFVAPFVSSFPDSAAMATFRSDSYWLDWRTRFFANVLTELTVVPTLVMMVRDAGSGVRSLTRWQVLEQACFWTGLMAAGFVVFQGAAVGVGSFGVLFGLPLFFLLPFLLWATVRLGPAGTSIALLVIELLAIWGGAHGRGPFRFAPPVVNVLYLQMFLFVWAIPFMCLAALIEERRASEAIKSAIVASLTSNVAVFNRRGRVIALTETWGRAGTGGAWNSKIGTDSGETYAEVCRRVLPLDGPYVDEVLAGVRTVIDGSRLSFSLQYPTGFSPSERWFAISALPFQRAGGGAVVSHTDVTEQRQTELEANRIRDELTNFTRVATVGALAASLAHELNQPLGAVLSNAEAAQLLLERGVNRSELEMILKDIIGDTHRAGDVIRRLRALLRNSESEFQRLDVSEVADEVLDLAHNELTPRDVIVVRRLAAGLPAVVGDRVQLQQVLLNLILNACDAMADTPRAGRTLTVTTSGGPDGTVEVSVGDRGTGISSAVRGLLFEAFVTTKKQGLGLGLAICRSIITAHGGRLWAENNRDQGATFHFSVPVASLRVAENMAITRP